MQSSPRSSKSKEVISAPGEMLEKDLEGRKRWIVSLSLMDSRSRCGREEVKEGGIVGGKGGEGGWARSWRGSRGGVGGGAEMPAEVHALGDTGAGRRDRYKWV